MLTGFLYTEMTEHTNKFVNPILHTVVVIYGETLCGGVKSCFDEVTPFMDRCLQLY